MSRPGLAHRDDADAGALVVSLEQLLARAAAAEARVAPAARAGARADNRMGNRADDRAALRARRRARHLARTQRGRPVRTTREEGRSVASHRVAHRRRPTAAAVAPLPRPTVAILVPAHNEEALIGALVDSLLDQSLVPDRFIVVADNCTDRTAEIARAKGVEVLETVGNTAKKAGALNQGFRLVRDVDVVVQVDADIVCDRDFVKELTDALWANPTAGALCARVGVQDYHGSSRVGRVLWRLQRLEYYSYDSIRVANRGRVWCISGIGGAYRGEALRGIAAGRPGPWDEESIVEDYTITLDIEERGWRTGSAMRAFAWSDTMGTFRDLWRQRTRWNRGTFAEWQRRPDSEAMRSDRRVIRRGLALTAITPFYLTVLTLTIVAGRFALNWWSVVITAAFAAERLYRLRYVPRTRPADIVMTATLVPEFLYRSLLDVNVVWCRLVAAVRRRSARQLSW